MTLKSNQPKVAADTLLQIKTKAISKSQLIKTQTCPDAYPVVQCDSLYLGDFVAAALKQPIFDYDRIIVPDSF